MRCEPTSTRTLDHASLRCKTSESQRAETIISLSSNTLFIDVHRCTTLVRCFGLREALTCRFPTTTSSGRIYGQFSEILRDSDPESHNDSVTTTTVGLTRV